jgi:hypothetical protein
LRFSVKVFEVVHRWYSVVVVCRRDVSQLEAPSHYRQPFPPAPPILLRIVLSCTVG